MAWHGMAWRVLTGLNKTITLSFLIVEYTKLSPDWCFSPFKQQYRRTRIGSLDDTVRLVESSAVVNHAQLIGTQDGKVLIPTYDWATFFDQPFRQLVSWTRPLPLQRRIYCITSMRREGSGHSGTVFVSHVGMWTWPIRFKLQQWLEILNAPGVEIKVWLSKLVRVWSKINALSADTGDHTTSCYAHIPARCIPLCHKNCARVARPSLCMLVMQYIQCCGGSGVVHETIWQQALKGIKSMHHLTFTSTKRGCVVVEDSVDGLEREITYQQRCTKINRTLWKRS